MENQTQCPYRYLSDLEMAIEYLGEYFKVRGYMEMHSMCNVVDMQMMCGIYIKW